ncbi:DinB family protein [Bacillus paramycoides]|uniref:DinB family protein n=1 Tax=Bacillus paramycoides TaxID=2026194 RepID=UPI003D02090E
MSLLESHNLLETRDRLISEISLLSYDEFNRSPERNKWSVAQICHHLILAEKLFTKAIVLGLRNIDNKTEHKNINLVLDRTKKLEAPEMVKPTSEPIEVQQIIDMLNDSRNKLLAVLSTVKDKSLLAEKSAKHPVFGELSLDQWIELLYLHEQRHIEQIKEIKLLIGIGN